MLGNLGLGEILIILVLILILFGPQKIPELAGTVGRFIAQFRRQMEEAQRAVIEPLRSDLHGPLQDTLRNTLHGPPADAGYPLGGQQPPAVEAPPRAAPPPLTEEEERARQPKRLLD